MSTTQSPSGTSQLDATIQALKGGLAGAASAAGPNIAGWITTLQGNQQLAGISAELQKLHDALTSNSPDASALAHSLNTLGEHTTKTAATPDAQAGLKELGELLSSAASQLRG